MPALVARAAARRAGAPAARPRATGAAAVYLPACINRIFGASRRDGTGGWLPEALVAVSARAGLPVWIPPDVAGHCCATPWSSKGYREGHADDGGAHRGRAAALERAAARCRS